MGASASKTNLEDLKQKATKLHTELTQEPNLLEELSKVSNNPNNLCGILNDIMQPYEIMYFVESMLPMLQGTKTVNYPANDETVMVVLHMSFISIYKQLVVNKDTILQRIKKLSNAPPPTGGKRASPRRKSNV